MAEQVARERLAAVAREQAGYVTTAQARRLGLKSGDLGRMARRNDLRRVRHGVYAFPGSFPSPREETVVAWLRLHGDRLPWDRGDPAAVVSHASAADVHGFGTFVPAAPTFTVFRRRFQPADESIRIYTARLDPTDWQWVLLPEGIKLAVTTPARTVVDLAFAGEERDHVLDAVAEAREAGLADDDEIGEAVDRRAARRGRGSIRWLRDAVDRT